jgi:hypothetical protein
MPVCQYLGWDILQKASKYQQHLGFLQMDSSPDRHPNSFAVFGHRAGTFQPCVLGRSLRGLFRFLRFASFMYRSQKTTETTGDGSKPYPPVVHIKIAGKWMFIPLKMVCIGIDP